MSSQVQIFTTTGATGRQGEIVNPATGGQTPLPIDLEKFRAGGGCGLLVTIAEGSSADYDIEITGNTMQTAADLKAWNKHDVVKAKKASANGNLAYPVTAVRLYFRSIAGTVTFVVIQPDS